MIVSIHQPSYFPWLGWLHKVVQSDVFVLLDNVQLADRAYQHRNLFLTNDGREKMLSISLQKKGYRDLGMKNIALHAETDWQKEHLAFIKNNYIKHPYYKEVMSFIEPVFTKHYSTLGDVLYDVTMIVASVFDIKTKIVRQDNIVHDINAQKSELMLSLCKGVGATTYLSGQGAKAYMDDTLFENEGISVTYQQFTHPYYKQLSTGSTPDKFIQGICCLDLLFNVGVEESRRILYGI